MQNIHNTTISVGKRQNTEPHKSSPDVKAFDLEFNSQSKQ